MSVDKSATESRTSYKKPANLRELTEADLDAVARVHRDAFSESALTRLGREAVRRYYHWQLTGPHDCYAIGVFDGARLDGFCFGGVFRGALSGFLNENRLFLLQKVLLRPHLIATPPIRDSILLSLKAITKRDATTDASTRNEVPTSNKSFGILAVAVSRSRQGEGLGQLLMEASEHEARHRRFESMHLTVSPDNEQAVRFYKRQGWTRDVSGDSWSGRMKKSLQVDAS